MQHPLYPYLAKEDRPAATNVPLNFSLNNLKYAYCHIEECWKPINHFSFFKINARGFVPQAVCKDCQAKKITLAGIYRKCGQIKEIFKSLRVKPTPEEVMRVNYQEAEEIYVMKSMAIC
jgi:hypothetical protein